MISYSGGKPGLQPSQFNQPTDVFYSGRWNAQYIPVPVTVSGNLTSWAANAPYTFYVRAGMPMGKVTSTGTVGNFVVETGTYANSIIGQTTAAYTSGGTTLTTDVNTAAEIVRRIGTSGTFITCGPPSAAGTVASTTTTFSAVNTSTGAITVTSLGVNKVSGAWIQPTDGSATILTLVCDVDGIKVADGTNVNRVDAFDPQLLAGGGCINVGQILYYPTDTAMQAYLKAALLAFCTNGVTFSDQY